MGIKLTEEKRIHMPQSLSKVTLHIIFSTKNRTQLIDPQFEKELYAYTAQIIKNLNAHAFQIGGIEDHIHIATTLPRTITQSDFIRQIKVGSSKWLKSKYINDFSWQSGYGSFSISESHIPNLINYSLM